MVTHWKLLPIGPVEDIAEDGSIPPRNDDSSGITTKQSIKMHCLVLLEKLLEMPNE